MKKIILLSALLFSFNGWAECIEGNCVNGQGTYNYANGNQYIGEFKDGRHHGQGTYTFAERSFDGDQYIGGWKDNKIHGQGTYTWADGNQYIGGWEDNNKHGQGTFTWADGNQYIGGWKDNQKHGQGTYNFADGGQYIGEYKDGKRHGQGTHTFANGNQYIGGWKNAQPHGLGTKTWADGDNYLGEFKAGYRSGQGTHTWAKTGNVYVGDFVNGKRTGQGTYTNVNGGQYIGGFKDGKAHGLGTYTYANGELLIGEWSDGVNLEIEERLQKEQRERDLRTAQMNAKKEAAEKEQGERYLRTAQRNVQRSAQRNAQINAKKEAAAKKQREKRIRDTKTYISSSVNSLKCKFTSCAGDKDFTGKGSYIQKVIMPLDGRDTGARCERSGSFKKGVPHGKGKQVCKNKKGKTYLVFEGTYNNGTMWTGNYSEAGRTYRIINGEHLDPVVMKQKAEQAKKAQRRKSIDALVRASGRISDMSNAPGTRQVTLGDFGRVLNEELNGGGNSRSNRKDTDWDWDYLKASREWRCRGIQSGQFASNYNCRNDRKDDDRWPTK
jgi:hypothetical protein